MALGAGSVTLADGHRLFGFANGGYRVQPYVIRKFATRKSEVIAAAAPVTVGEESSRVIDPRNAFLMDTMLRDVTIYGTAAKASVALKRHDLAGKTGTTNEYVDAWFCGYQMTVTGCAWIGFDQPKKLGDRRLVAPQPLPIWIGYMTRPAGCPGQPAGTSFRPGGLRQRQGTHLSVFGECGEGSEPRGNQRYGPAPARTGQTPAD